MLSLAAGPSQPSLQPAMLRSSNRPSKTPEVAPRDLSLPEAYHLLAALMQFTAMVLLSLAIYMRNWVWLEANNNLLGPQPFVFYTFGLPYKLDTSRNTSEYFFQKDRHPLRLIVIMVCFLNLLFGIAAFLLNFLALRVLERYRTTLVSSFHIFSGISTMVLVAICVWCFEKVRRWFVEPERKEYAMFVQFGVSFYIGLLAFGCAIWAGTFTVCALRLSSKLKTPSKAPETKQ